MVRRLFTCNLENTSEPQGATNPLPVTCAMKLFLRQVMFSEDTPLTHSYPPPHPPTPPHHYRLVY